MRNAINREIVELHTFFEDWLGGRLPANDQVFQRFTSVVDPNFTLVTPEGKEWQRAELLSMLRQGHGSRPHFHIWIEHLHLLQHCPPLVLARYEECQNNPEGFTRRISTAIFKEEASAINGLLWLRVHETWAVSKK